MAMKVEKLGVFNFKRIFRQNLLQKDKETINKSCYLYKTFKANGEDYDMFLDELKTAKIVLYAFDCGRVSVGQTKICPWCLGGKVKVDDWTAHCKLEHPRISSPDRLRQFFMGYRCQSTLYKLLTVRLRKNWKQIGILEGGCYQCANTKVMFDGSENTKPKRCVRMDTPKSRMRSFAFCGVDIKRLKKR